MFTEEELTEERVDVMIAALEDEKGQVAQALAIHKAQDVDGDVANAKRIKRLESRGKAIDAELKTWKGRKSGGSKSSSRGGKVDVEVADE